MYDVMKRHKRPSPALLAAFAEIGESASIHEVMGKTGALSPDFRPIWPRQRLCGSALTVHSPAGDNLMLHKAVSLLLPGDVIVLSNDRDSTKGGMMGGLLLSAAKARGAVGLITDGACRDTVALAELGFPVWSRGISIHGTTKLLPGSINHPLIVGGVRIHPGDIVFADNDGVVAVPLDRAEEVLEKAKAREENEERLLRDISAGKVITFDLGGIGKNYAALGLSEEP